MYPILDLGEKIMKVLLPGWLLCVREHIRVDKPPQLSCRLFFIHSTSTEGEVGFAELAPN